MMNDALRWYLDFSRQHWRSDFISPEMMQNSSWASYEDSELRRLCESLPDPATLLRFRKNNIILMAGPPNAMSLLDILACIQRDSRFGGLIRNENPAWDSENIQGFAKQDKIDGLCWFAFSHMPVASTLSHDWSFQQLMVSEPKRIPNAAEIMWALTTSLIVNDVRLFGDFIIRSSSLSSNGHPVIFSTDLDGRINISTHAEKADPILGVVTMEKFPA